MRSIGVHPSIVGLVVLAAAGACSRDREPRRDEPATAVRRPDAAVPARPYACREVARHFAIEYLGLRASDDLVGYIERDCELNDWAQAERACWMQIADMATHQRCVTEFAEPRMRRPDYKNPDDEDDDFLEDDDE